MIESNRLRLRQWRENDKKLFAKMNADADVMRYFPSTLTEQQSNDLVDRLSGLIDTHGYGFWAAERCDNGNFIGFIGINYSDFDSPLPFAPCVDIGWRLAKEVWGQGYATEGALAALDFGFNVAGLTNIVSMTPVSNAASENVMRKIGMRKRAENFYYPDVPREHTLSEHVLYELSKSQWLEREA